MFHTIFNTFLGSATRELIYRQKNTERNLYCNHSDTFWDINKKLKGSLVDIHKNTTFFINTGGSSVACKFRSW